MEGKTSSKQLLYSSDWVWLRFQEMMPTVRNLPPGSERQTGRMRWVLLWRSHENQKEGGIPDIGVPFRRKEQRKRRRKLKRKQMCVCVWRGKQLPGSGASKWTGLSLLRMDSFPFFPNGSFLTQRPSNSFPSFVSRCSKYSFYTPSSVSRSVIGPLGIRIPFSWLLKCHLTAPAEHRTDTK